MQTVPTTLGTPPMAPAASPAAPAVQDPSQAPADAGTPSLDPQAVMLAKAIRQTESGGDFAAQGKSGEYGAYQWTAPTWQKMASSAGLSDLSLQDATPEQQNEVAYKQIKSWKDAGYNVGQIASMWNAGAGKPNAYLDGNAGTNSSGVAYDTQKYAQKVAQNYQTLKGGGEVAPGGTPSTALGVGDQSQSAPSDSSVPSGGAELLDLSKYQQPNGGDNGPSAFQKIGDDISKGNIGGAAWDAGKSLLNFVFPIIGDIGGDINGTNKKSVLQQVGDLGTSALGAIAIGALLPESIVGAGAAGVLGMLTGADAASVAGRIGAQAAFGGAMGLSSGLAAGQTNLGSLAGSTAAGGAIGGIAGTASELISKAADMLPSRITRAFIPGINQDTADYAVSKGLGSPEKMLEQSNSSISSLGKTLGAALEHPQYDGLTITSKELVPNIIDQFPNAGLTDDALKAALQKVAPLQKNLIDKLFTDEGLSLDELHTLNSAMGQNTFKTVFDDPVTKAGKDLASAFYHTSSDAIKSVAPETAPIFDQLSKEYPLKQGLQKAVRAGQKAKFFTLKDVMALVAGGGVGGPLGGAVALAGEKALSNPTVNLTAAGALAKLGGVGVRSFAPVATAVGAKVAPTVFGTPSQ